MFVLSERKGKKAHTTTDEYEDFTSSRTDKKKEDAERDRNASWEGKRDGET